VYRQALPYDRDGTLHDKLAFAVCDCQEAELRAPGEALALAKQAVTLAPRRRDFWNTLGLAYFRAGDWSAGRAALAEAMALSAGGDGRDWLILAMISWREGHPQESRSWYDKAAGWLETTPLTDELFHLRRDAAELLAIRWP
jgi:uncharacterized protein HemY